MLKCRELAQRHASDYLDGQLSLRWRWAVRFHLAICTHCRRFMRQITVVRKLLRGHAGQPRTAVDEQEMRQLAYRLHELHRRQEKS